MSMLPRISFDHSRPLTEEELRQVAPSVFSTHPHPSRSERFRHISTFEVLRRLEGEGFYAVDATQSRARTDDKRPYTKHCIRLRRLGEDVQYKVGGTIFEVILKNGNDGSASWDLMAALFEILCLNGCVADVGEADAFKVRHTGDAMSKVIDGTYAVLRQSEQALAAVIHWRGLQLEPEERTAFATAAHRLRFANKDGEITTAIRPAQLLETRRREDVGTNLWKTYQVVQENMIRGGLTAIGQDAAMRTRKYTSRAIRGVDQDIHLNRELFGLANKVATKHGVPSVVPERQAA